MKLRHIYKFKPRTEYEAHCAVNNLITCKAIFKTHYVMHDLQVSDTVVSPKGKGLGFI